eukprot:m.265118 g.265118  ORF g.265118 m.265118 type:complete len:61 (+) comp29293_c0_seq1:687-869(+)
MDDARTRLAEWIHQLKTALPGTPWHHTCRVAVATGEARLAKYQLIHTNHTPVPLPTLMSV